MDGAAVAAPLLSAPQLSVVSLRVTGRLPRTKGIPVREDYYGEYAVFEERNWWFVSRRRIIRRVLQKHLPPAVEGRRVLDAGCGTGINLRLLREFGDVDGVDNSELAISFCHALGEESVRQADLCDLPFESGSYDLVTALDVLEHIEDDRGALAELVRVCRPGGRLLLTVPSFPSLWSDHDIVNHHVRRYHPRDFRELVSETGLNIQHESGMNFFLLPVAYLWRTYRKIFRQRPSPQGPRADNTHQAPPVNALLRAIFSAESPLIAGPGLPLGLSILCLAEKREA